MKNRVYFLDLVAVGIGLFSVLFLALIITSLMFILGYNINKYIFPVSALLGAMIVYIVANRKYGSVLLYCGILILSLLIALSTYDYSFDGQWYHIDTIYQLKNGWNPIYSHHAENANQLTAVWVNHYAKGFETIAATIYSFTNKVETGKAANLILIFSSFFILYGYLEKEWGVLSKYKRIYYAVIVTLSPIVVTQCLTFYIDWSMYSLLLITISVLAFLRNKQNILLYCILGSLVFFAATIKFNILFWICFFIFCFLLYFLYCKKYSLVLKSCIVLFLFFVMGVVVGGFNPYITNLIDHSNPFYPLLGNNNIDIMTDHTPINMQHNSSIHNILISLFSHCTNDLSKPTSFCFPFYFTIEDLYYTGGYDTKIAGFGVFFSGILLLCLILFPYLYYKIEKKKCILALILLLILFFALLMLPSGWWARYNPYFYLFPIVILLLSELTHLPKFLKWIRRGIYLFLFLNIGLMFSVSIYKNYTNYVETRNILQYLLKSNEDVHIDCGNNIAFKIKLEENGVKYVEVRDSAASIYNILLTPSIKIYD